MPVVIHSYRHRYGNAPSDPRFEETERLLATRPKITVQTIVLQGAADMVGSARRSTSSLALFPPATEVRVLQRVGHFTPREQPDALVDALSTLLR